MGRRDVEGEAPSAAQRPSASVDVHVGASIDKYTVVRLLGKGGMGAVYEARHATLSRRFAIKFLLPHVATNADVVRRFKNEAKAAGGLEHPNLVAVTDFGTTDDGAPYLVMEFLPGRDCATLLREGGPLPVPRATNIVLQACRGLAVAHQAKIVHRDLKPENLFLTDAGDGNDLIKVLDFGIAKLRVSDASVATGTGQAFGTAHYMSPEQARGASEVDERSDVWSLGVVLYELLSGVKPFQGAQFLEVAYQILSTEPEPLVRLRPELPAVLLTVVEQAMTKAIDQRIPSVKALGELLAPFAGTRGTGPEHVRSAAALGATMPTPATGWRPSASAPVEGRSPSPSPSAMTPSPRSSFSVKRILGVAIVAAVIVGVVAAILATRDRPGGDTPAQMVSGAPSVPAPRAQPVTPVPPRAAAASTGPKAAVPNAGTGSIPVTGPAPALTPASSASGSTEAARAARTVFEHSQLGSNKHAARTAWKSMPTGAPPAAPPNPALPLDKPTQNHRIQLDKEDPFGP